MNGDAKCETAFDPKAAATDIAEYLASTKGQKRVKECCALAKRKADEFSAAARVDRTELHKPFTV